MASDQNALARLDAREDAAVETCMGCPRLCRWSCPVAEAEARETVSPHALVVLGGLVKRGVVPAESAAELPFHCTYCGACTEACLHKNDVRLVLAFARKRAMENHLAPAKVAEVRGNFGMSANPHGQAHDGVLARISEEADVAIERSGRTIYFPGCETLASYPEAATAFLRTTLLFGFPGVSVTPASASCCGMALLHAGDLEGFRHHALRFANGVAEAETLVVHDAACAVTLKTRYADFGVELAPKIIHVAELLGTKLAEPPTSPVAAPNRDRVSRIAYSDSCSLARGLEVVDVPRKILERIAEDSPIEIAALHGREADCCGASGLLPLTAPATARAMAESRIQAFRASGAKELAMMSPRCVAHLKKVDPTVPAVDLTMLLARL